jgi:glycogen synthase
MLVRRVLMSADAVGGVWTFSLELAQGLTARGVEVLLAVMGPAPDRGRMKAADQIRGLRVEHRPYPLEWMLDASDENQAEAGEWLLGLAREFAPDVVHLNHYDHGHLAWPAPCVVVAHSCVASWHEYVRGEPAGPMWDGYRRRVARGLAGTQLVVAPTQAMLSDLKRLYDVDFPGAVIHNGRQIEAFPQSRKQPFVFCAGRVWDEAKNIAALDAAARYIEWPVRVAGDVRHPEGGTARFSHVQLVGALGPSAMAASYARASIYALPARYEPFGLSVVEAAFAGCALVLGDIPSLRELWDDTALYVPPNDPDAIARTVNDLAKRRRALHEQGARARRHASRYTSERMVNHWKRTYGELLRKEDSCTS